MFGHHGHKKISTGDLEAGLNAFTRGGHNTTWLAEMVISFAKRSSLTKTQTRALEQFHELKRRTDNLQLANESGMTDLFGMYFSLFDGLYFFGSLTGHCTLGLGERQAENIGRLGQTFMIHRDMPDEVERATRMSRYSVGEGEKKVYIKIWRRDKEIPHMQTRICRYVATLLHEMIHAFLQFWSCDYKGCSTVWEKRGKYEHGCAFMDIAAVLGKNVREREIMNINFNLEASLALELVQSFEKPKREYEKWGLDYDILEKEFVRFQKMQTANLGGEKPFF